MATAAALNPPRPSFRYNYLIHRRAVGYSTASAHHVQVAVAIAIGIEKHRSGVFAGLVFLYGRLRHLRKPPAGLLYEHSARLSGASTNKYITGWSPFRSAAATHGPLRDSRQGNSFSRSKSSKSLAW
jgi:hypothetical protein